MDIGLDQLRMQCMMGLYWLSTQCVVQLEQLSVVEKDILVGFLESERN